MANPWDWIDFVLNDIEEWEKEKQANENTTKEEGK